MRTKADKGEGGQFLPDFCGRPLWMTPIHLCTSVYIVFFECASTRPICGHDLYAREIAIARISYGNSV